MALPFLSLFGDKLLRGNFAKMTTMVPPRAFAKTRADVEVMMTESRIEVPVDTGALMSSAFVKVVNAASPNWAIEAGYNKDYAFFVHEIPARHTVGKSHFLIDPANRHFGEFESVVGGSLSRTLLGGFTWPRFPI